MEVDNTINGCMAFLTKVSVNLSDIKYHYDNYGGGANSSAYKMQTDLEQSFGELGELITLLRTQLAS